MEPAEAAVAVMNSMREPAQGVVEITSHRSPVVIAAQITQILPDNLALELRRGYKHVSTIHGPFAAPERHLPDLMNLLGDLSQKMDKATLEKVLQVCNHPEEGVPKVNIQDFMKSLELL